MAMATEQPNKPMLWGGRVVSALPVLALLMSGAMKLSHRPEVVQGLVQQGGFPEGSITPIGVVEVLSALLYAFPQTSVLGAVLCTGYLGGAVATHVHGSQGFLTPALLGVMVWAGLFLRDARLRALLPLRRPA
jgi:DoxX-like family